MPKVGIVVICTLVCAGMNATALDDSLARKFGSKRYRATVVDSPEERHDARVASARKRLKEANAFCQRVEGRSKGPCTMDAQVIYRKEIDSAESDLKAARSGGNAAD